MIYSFFELNCYYYFIILNSKLCSFDVFAHNCRLINVRCRVCFVSLTPTSLCDGVFLFIMCTLPLYKCVCMWVRVWFPLLLFVFQRIIYSHTQIHYTLAASARNVQFSNPPTSEPTKSAPHSALSSIVVVVEPSLYSVRPTHFDRSAAVDSRDLHESARANSKRISRLGCLYLSSCNSLCVFFVICCNFGCNPQDLTINCIRKMPNESNQQKCVCLLQWLRQRLVSCCPVLGSGGR